MESPPLAYIPQKSKKRVFPGSSSSYMDPDVVEISPPINRSSKSKSLKQKEVLVKCGHFSEPFSKNKTRDSLDGAAVGRQTNADAALAHLFIDDNEIVSYLVLFNATYSQFHRKESDARMISLCFDTRDIVICHEVIDVDMYEDCGGLMILGGKVDTNSKGKEPVVNFSSEPGVAAKLGSMNGVDSLTKSSAVGSENLNNLDSFSTDLSYGNEYLDIYCDDFMYDDDYAILQSHFDNIDFPSGVEAPIPWLPGPAQCASMPATEPAQIRKTSSSSSSRSKIDVNPQPKVDSSFGFLTEKFAPSKKNVAVLSDSTYSSLQTQSGDVNFPSGPKPFRSSSRSVSSHGKRKPVVSGGTSSSSSHEQLGGMQLNLGPGIQPFCASNYSNSRKKQLGSAGAYSSPHFPTGTKNPPPPMPLKWENFLSMQKQSMMSAPPYPGLIHPNSVFSGGVAHDPWFNDLGQNKSVTDVGNSTVPLVSSSSMEKYGDDEEILKKFQLFKKFDTVEDHSDHHYLRNGSSVKQPSKNWAKKIQDEWKILEKDLPDTIFVRVYESRMDLLRAVIVGAEGTPYHDGLFFFDVFFPSSYPNVPPIIFGKRHYKHVNSECMLDTHFEDLVLGHYLTRAHEILVACKAYMDGAQVGCLVRGGVQDVDEGDKSCSQAFKANLLAHMDMLVKAFKQVGAKDCDKFLSLTQTGSG
ncbi:hypothetical protein LguiA_023118 [Lonicera macranthoides]